MAYELSVITKKLDDLEEIQALGIQSSELDTGQTKTKVVYSTKSIDSSIEIWKYRLKKFFPYEYRDRYGSDIVSFYTNRRSD